MAENDQDRDQKTEQPTARRLDEARAKGNIPISREVGAWTLLLAALLSVAWFLPQSIKRLAGQLVVFFDRPEDFILDIQGLRDLLISVSINTGAAVFGVIAFLVVAAIMGTMMQTGPFLSTETLKPSLERASPVKGFQRIFSGQALIELAKGFFKIIVVGLVSAVVLWPLIRIMPQYVGMEAAQVSAFVADETVRLGWSILMIITIIAIADLFWQRFDYMRNLRMTKQEVRDESRQSEGDPLIRSRVKQIRLERARKRMMSQVPKADVVITNPTHYAVALQYDESSMNAPIVLAKGMNLIADRIRELATENKIPLVSNPPLARSLYDAVDVDRPIKPEHYRAVAEIISYVWKLKKRK